MMPNDVQFKVGTVGTGKYSTRDNVASAVDLLMSRVATIAPDYQIRVNHDEWSEQERGLHETKIRIHDLASHADPGFTCAVRGSRTNQSRFILKAVIELFGDDVVQAAIKQLGVDYSWADEDPAGGGSAGFDCSGFVKWCYAQVDIVFPHQAEAIRDDNQVTHFGNRNDIKPGDLIFYCYGRLGPGTADHIAIATSKDTQIAASSSADAVVRQSIDIGDVMHYGFVREVTGAH